MVLVNAFKMRGTEYKRARGSRRETLCVLVIHVIQSPRLIDYMKSQFPESNPEKLTMFSYQVTRNDNPSNACFSTHSSN
ncbi:hypothetical protein AN958_11241 [Leucoagaricus sp. SymC.cos]|nr:hypothetical protein AN958_11241 [Leucoagaricus sp. SymC.cos]